MSLTFEEIAAILDAYWDQTGEWDPLVNGTIAAEMDKAGDPNDPALTPEERHQVIEARGRAGERYWSAHDRAVGQRVACRQLTYRFEEAIKAKVAAR